MSGELKTGDVVRLKSGGPSMTISRIYTNTSGDVSAHCKWFADSEIKEANIPLISLEID